MAAQPQYNEPATTGTETTTSPTTTVIDPTTGEAKVQESQVVEQPKQNLVPGGYPCMACGITFRTPQELDKHKSKNADKKPEEHIQ